MKTFDLGAVTAYALAVENGFKGTIKEWLDSLVGATPNLTIGKVETLEPTEKATATLGGTPENPVLNLAIPSGKNGHAADWNQSDPSQPDYVMNRTHYEGVELVEILPECQPTFVEGEGLFLVESVPALVIGETYIVIWNGTEYTCVAQDATSIGGSVGLGDIGAIGAFDADATTGDPFVFVAAPSDGVSFVLPLDGSTSVTLSIKQEQSIVTPLPVKYLHPSVPWVEDGAEASLNIVFDGDMTGKETTQMGEGNYLVKVSDAVLSLEDLTGATMVSNENGTENSAVVGTDILASDMSSEGLPLLAVNEFIFAVQEDFAVEGISLTKGVWFLCTTDDSGTAYVQSLSNPNAIVSGGTTINKLDNRCLDLDWLPVINETQEEVLGEVVCSTYTDAESNGQDIWISSVSDAINLVVGETYAVTWRGTEYSCVAYADGEYIAIGDFQTTPFAIVVISGTGTAIQWSDADSAPTVSVHHVIVEPNQMPAKFLPEDATVFYLTSPNGTKFAVTVADDGTLSAAEVTS